MWEKHKYREHTKIALLFQNHHHTRCYHLVVLLPNTYIMSDALHTDIKYFQFSASFNHISVSFNYRAADSTVQTWVLFHVGTIIYNSLTWLLDNKNSFLMRLYDAEKILELI